LPDTCSPRPDRPIITPDALELCEKFVRWSQAAFRWPLSACRSPLSALRCPLSAFRCPLAALRIPLAACRLPQTLNAERNNPTRTGLSPDTHFSLAEIAEHAKNVYEK